MARLISDFLTEARRMVNDTRAPYRFPDVQLLDNLNQGLRELARLRPDAFIDTFVDNDIVVPEFTSSDLADTFPLGYQFYTPLLMFTVGSIELTDDEFTVDGRAITLMQKFTSSVVGV
jgi:hypothetical protein